MGQRRLYENVLTRRKTGEYDCCPPLPGVATHPAKESMDPMGRMDRHQQYRWIYYAMVAIELGNYGAYCILSHPSLVVKMFSMDYRITVKEARSF